MTGHLLFFLSILVIAFILWAVRSLVESDPDPFFLNLTFFAFAGQLIRLTELIAENTVTRLHHGLLLAAVLVVGGQIWVSRQHKNITLDHYKDLLKRHAKKSCQDADIERWSGLLLQMTGVDFWPGGYKWMTRVPLLQKEPRKKSREQGFLILPNNKFETSQFSSVDLIVPEHKDRKTLWNCYVGFSFVAWILFGTTVFIRPTVSEDVPEPVTYAPQSMDNMHPSHVELTDLIARSEG